TYYLRLHSFPTRRSSDLAIDAMEKLIAKWPGDIRPHLLLGQAYLEKREPAKAADAYRKVIALAPKDPQGPYLVGVALRAQRKNRSEEHTSELQSPDHLVC